MASSESSNKRPRLATDKANVLMVGTGEYTTGYVGGKAADSDKGAGVVALTMFDLRRRGKVDRLGMCGVNVGGSPRARGVRCLRSIFRRFFVGPVGVAHGAR